MNKRRLLLLLGPVAAALVGLYFYMGSGRYVSTENAFVKADKVIISPEVAGPVSELLVTENQKVAAGDLLFRIDAASYEAAVLKAQAKLAEARSTVLSLQASYRAKQGELKLARNNLAFAEKEYHRQVDLAAKGFVSKTLLDERQHQLDVTRQQELILQQDLDRVLASLNGDAKAPVEQHPAYLSAEAELKSAEINLARTALRAPFDGIASNVPKLGQHLNAGSPAMSVVADKDLWIEANFNETDLTHVQTGQDVEIRIDMYPQTRWHGTVASLSPATGAEFSVLPPQNATGNWVKVVQRIPVRIRIEQGAADSAEAQAVLRAGMSAHIKIDTRPAKS